MSSPNKSSILPLLAVVLAMGGLVACPSDDGGGDDPGTLEPSSDCPATEPAQGGECIGVASCPYVDDTCSGDDVTIMQQQCYCDGGAWSCETIEVQCNEVTGAGSDTGNGGGTASGNDSATGDGTATEDDTASARDSASAS